MSVSAVGLVLALLYLPPAIFIVQDELRHSHGGWINLRGFGTRLVTAPSQVTLGWLLARLGVRSIDWSRPGVSGHAQLVAHVAVSAAFSYGLGAGIEWLVRGITA